jgi:release factor glutamine methyltransferase
MSSVARYLAHVFYKPLLVRYLSKERQYTHSSVRLKISPEVFHPGFFFSTKLLLKHVLCLTLAGKKFLELGAGSGLISIKAAKAGAYVTATDINPAATRFLGENARKNQVDLTIIESNLFENIPPQVFDTIAINPPYYLKTPATMKEYAWYCGENGEYFKALFAGLGNYTDRNSVIFMILCEGANRELIGAIADAHGFVLTCISVSRNLIERNYVYRVHHA